MINSRFARHVPWLLAALAVVCHGATPATAPPGRFDVRYLPGYKRFWIDRLEVFDQGIAARARSVELQVRPKRGGPPVLSKRFDVKAGRLENKGVEGLDLASGEYVATGIVRDETGKDIAELPGLTRMEIFRSPDTPTGRDHHDFASFGHGTFPFIEHMDRLLRPLARVPKPFTPVECVENVVSVWGRDHEIAATGLPAQITVRQPEPTLQGEWEPVLAAPVRLVLVRGRRRDAMVPMTQNLRIEHDPIRATWSCAGRVKGVAVTLTANMQYDGVCVYDMEYGPVGQPVACDGLVLDIPMREEHATLMHALSDAVGLEHSGAVPGGTGVLWDSAERVNRKLYGTFRAMVWLGTEDRGLCWFGDSDRGYTLSDYAPTLVVRRERGQVVLEVRVVNHATTLTARKAVRFGLLATPVKPLPRDWRRWIFPCWRALGGLKHLFQQPIWSSSEPPHMFGNMANLPAEWDASKREMAATKQIHPDAVRMLYMCMNNFCLGTPEMALWGGEWARPSRDCAHCGTRFFKGLNAIYAITDRTTPSYQAYRLWALEHRLKRLGLHSHYEDNAQQGVHFDLAKGMGYIRADGKRQPEFDTLGCREYYRRQARVFTDHGYPNLVAVHKSYSMLAPAFTHVTVTIDGEQPGQSTVERDYIDVWTEWRRDWQAYFRSHILGRQFGNIAAFLTEIRLKAHDDPTGRASRACLAMLLPHDIKVWPGWQRNGQPFVAWWRVIDAFGFGRKPMRFYPYWASPRRRAVSVQEPDVCATAWQSPDGTLMVVSNYRDARTVHVRLHLDRLGYSAEGALHIADAETGQAIASTGPDAFALPIPRHDYRLLLVKPAGRDVLAEATFDAGAGLSVGDKVVEPKGGKIGTRVPGISGQAYLGPPELSYDLGPLPPRGSVSLWISPRNWALAAPAVHTANGKQAGLTDQGAAGMYLKVEAHPIGDGRERSFLTLRVPAEKGKDNGFAWRLYSVGESGVIWAMFLDRMKGQWKAIKAIPADRMEDWKPGSWHHVVVTWDESPSHQAAGLCVDGRDWGKGYCYLTKDASRRPFALTILGPGAHNATCIDEATVYSRCLGPEECRRMYRARRPAN